MKPKIDHLIPINPPPRTHESTQRDFSNSEWNLVKVTEGELYYNNSSALLFLRGIAFEDSEIVVHHYQKENRKYIYQKSNWFDVEWNWDCSIDEDDYRAKVRKKLQQKQNKFTKEPIKN